MIPPIPTVLSIPTKEGIVKRLFEAGHVSLDEMLILLKDHIQVQYLGTPACALGYPSSPNIVWYTGTPIFNPQPTTGATT